MKICFFNINAYSLFNNESQIPVGGTEVQLYNLANYLSQISDLEVNFITGDWEQKGVEKYDKIIIYKSASIKKKFFNYLKFPFKIWNTLKKVNADVYIASSAGPEIGIIALFCKMYNKIFIYRAASSIDCNKEFVRKNNFFGKLYEFGLKKTSFIVVQNNENKNLLKKNYNINALVVKNSFVINNTNLDFKKEFILWVGRLELNKRPELFLEIAKKISSEKFVMIAPKQNHQKKLFEKIQEEAKKISSLEFIEKVPFSEVQEYFNKAKIFIGTSEYEGFPNVYLQACIGKTPIVSYKVNPDNFINKYNLGYCAEGSFEKMIEYIKKLLQDKEDWKTKSENAYKYVRENHDIEKVGKQWEELIYKLAKK